MSAAMRCASRRLFEKQSVPAKANGARADYAGAEVSVFSAGGDKVTRQNALRYQQVTLGRSGGFSV